MGDKTSGYKLTVNDINNVAVEIGELYDKYNLQRQTWLGLGQEVRDYIYATDLNTTTANNADVHNRTHIPKLTELSDTLQSNYWDAVFSEPKFFIFRGRSETDKQQAITMEAWIRTKLEQKKFRSEEGRKLVADFVIYGNAFMEADYVREVDDLGIEKFKGIVFRRISPLDIVFDATAPTFAKASKITKKTIHIADLEELPEKFPNAGYKANVINKVIQTRADKNREDWVDLIKEQGLSFDGFSNWDDYFKRGYCEVLTYKGDIFDPTTGKIQRNRKVVVVDRLHVIYNEPIYSPTGSHGIFHAPWRIRPDNLWGMGPLDNLAGMQYRVDKEENVKADVLDRFAEPYMIVNGAGFSGDSENMAALLKQHRLLFLDEGESFTIEEPNPAILTQADIRIATYFKLMEDFAGAPPEARGIRSPGEKTKFEVQNLDSKSAKTFKDKARQLEYMLEGALNYAFELSLKNFDGTDVIEVFDEIEKRETLVNLTDKDIRERRGDFIAVGAKHWDKKNKQKVEAEQLFLGFLQDPSLRTHLNSKKSVKFLERIYDLQDEGLFEENIGVKQGVEAQAIAQEEQSRLEEERLKEQGIPPEAVQQTTDEFGQVLSGGQGQTE